MTAAERNLRNTIERCVVLSRISARGKKADAELELYKAEFRTLANGQDLRIETPSGASVTVEQKGTTTMRVVPAERFAKILKLAGDKLGELFSLQPKKGEAQNFELNARRHLPAKDGAELCDLLTAPASAWVKFRSRSRNEFGTQESTKREKLRRSRSISWLPGF